MASSTRTDADGAQDLRADLTVHQVLERFPETLGVFNVHGIDSCCGGGIAVADAARRHGVDPDALMAALRGAVGEARASGDRA